MSVNYVHIDGNLTRDPEVRSVGNDKTVISFSIAYNTRKKNDAGSWVDGDPMFFDCEFWPTDAQYWIKRLGKGVGVSITGELKQDRWETDGQKRSAVRIRVSSISGRWLNEIGATSASAPGNNNTHSDDIPF